jgi:hypothetical protein
LIRRGASNERFQAEILRILNEKYEHHSKIYTNGSKKDEKVGYAVAVSESIIKRRQFPQNLIYSAEQSAIINAFYSTASYNQNRVIITDSLSTIIAVSDRKRSKNPKIQLIQKLIDQASITMGSESRRDTRKRNSRRRSKRSTERGNSPHRNISPTKLDETDKGKTRTRTTRKMGKPDHNHDLSKEGKAKHTT